MAIEMRRTRLGNVPNEGARQAWIEMGKRGWDQSDLRRAMKEQLDVTLESGLLVKLLYCDRRPGVEWSERFRVVLGVEPTAWYRDPEEPINVEDLRDAPPASTRTTPDDGEGSDAA